MPSATLATANDRDVHSTLAGSWSSGSFDYDMDAVSSLYSSPENSDVKQPRDLAYFRRVSFHSYGGTTGTIQPQVSPRRAKSCHRTFPKTPARMGDTAPSEPILCTWPRAKERDGSPSMGGIEIQDMVDVYHQQTLKLKDLVRLHQEKRQAIHADTVRKTQQLNKVRRQVAALRRLRSERPGLSGSVKDLKKTLKWQTRILANQTAEVSHRLESQDKRFEALLLSMLDATCCKASDAEMSKCIGSHDDQIDDDLLSITSQSSGLLSQCASVTTDGTLTESVLSEFGASPKGVLHMDSTDGIESFQNADMQIPEWFTVLESRKCVLLLSKGIKTRYVELLNKIYRLECEVQNEERERGREKLRRKQASPADPEKQESNLDAHLEKHWPQNVYVVAPRSQAMAPRSVLKHSVKEQYDTLMEHVNQAMGIVAEQDKSIVLARLGKETGCLTPGSLCTVTNPEDD